MTQAPVTQSRKNVVTAEAALTHGISTLSKRLDSLIQS